MQGGFKKRGQLKLVLCGSDEKATLTVMGLKSLPKGFCNSNPSSFVYVKMAIFPDIEKLIRHKTTPVQVTSSSVSFHESFTFAITRQEIHKRLLISVWCKCTDKDRSTFLGCMSFGVKSITNSQEITQGWYYLLKESYGRKKHLKSKVTANDYEKRHSMKCRHEKLFKGNNSSYKSYSVEDNKNCYENIPKLRPYSCELVNIDENYENDEVSRHRKRMEKLSKRRRVSFDPTTVGQYLSRPSEKLNPSAPKRCIESKGKEKTKSVFSPSLLQQPVGQLIAKTFVFNNANDCDKSEVKGSNCDPHTFQNSICSGNATLSCEPLQQNDDVFVDTKEQDIPDECLQAEIAPVFLVKTRTAKVIAPSSFKRSINRPPGTAGSLIVRTLSKQCDNSPALETKPSLRNILTLKHNVENVINTFEKQQHESAATSNADNIFDTTTEKILDDRDSQSSSSNSNDRGYHSDTGTCSARSSCQEVSDDVRLAVSEKLSSLDSNSGTRCLQESNVMDHYKPKNRCSNFRKSTDTILELPIVEENTANDNNKFGNDVKYAIDKNKKTRSSFKHWLRRKSSEGESKPKQKNSESEGQAKIKRSSLRRSKAKEDDLKTLSEADFSKASSLEEVLQSKVGMSAFHNFLKSEYSEENLDFWNECEAFKLLKKNKMPKTANRIYNYYIATGSAKEINIDAKIRESTKLNLANLSTEMFTEAQTTIYALMSNDSFRRFLVSSYAKEST